LEPGRQATRRRRRTPLLIVPMAVALAGAVVALIVVGPLN